MQVTATTPPVTAQPEQGWQPNSLLFRVAERFGLPVAILLLVLWWARTDVVQPLLDAHFDVVGEIVEGQKRQAEEVREVGKKLDRLIEITTNK